MRSVAKDAWREAQQLQGIAAARRKILHLGSRKRATDLPGFRVNAGCYFRGDRDGLRDFANFQSNVQGLGLFGVDKHIVEGFLLEPNVFNRDRVVPRARARKL